MNALRHGLRAQKVVLPNENPEEFDQIHAGLQAQYQPQTQAEQFLVDQAAIAQWKLVRAEVFEASYYAEEPSAKARAAIFDRVTQITGRLERAYFKAYKELERIKMAREKQTAQSKEDETPAKFQVTVVNPSTGATEVLYRAENGKPVKEFSNAPPSPTPPH